MIYPRDRAHSAFLKVAGVAECLNTRLSPRRGGFQMFTTSLETMDPFATKVTETVFGFNPEDRIVLLSEGGRGHLPLLPG